MGAGPALGGLILDTLGWHWAFWINVPFGLAGAVLGWLVIPQTRNLQGGGRFDWRGAFLIAPALTALVAALNQGYAWGLTSPALIGCVALAIVFLTLFVRAERRAETPLIDFRLLRERAFLSGNLANFMSYAMLFGVFFLIPFVLVRVYQDSAFAAGLRLSIVPVTLGLLAPVGGALYDRFGARAATASGMLICIAGLVVLYVFLDGAAASLPLVMLGLAVFGIGQGLFISPNSSAIMATAPAELTGEAGSLLNMVRYLGISTGIAGASVLLALRLAAGRGLDGSTVNAAGPTLVAASRDVIILLCCFGALAGALSLMRSVPRAARDAQGGEQAERPPSLPGRGALRRSEASCSSRGRGIRMAQTPKDRRSVEALAALLPAGVAGLSMGLAAADANASTAVADAPDREQVRRRPPRGHPRIGVRSLEAGRRKVRALCRGRPRDQARLVGQWRLAQRRLAQWLAQRRLGQRRLAQLGQRLAQWRLEQLGQRRPDRRPALASVRQSLGQRLAQLVAPLTAFPVVSSGAARRAAQSRAPSLYRSSSLSFEQKVSPLGPAALGRDDGEVALNLAITPSCCG